MSKFMIPLSGIFSLWLLVIFCGTSAAANTAQDKGGGALNVQKPADAQSLFGTMKTATTEVRVETRDNIVAASSAAASTDKLKRITKPKKVKVNKEKKEFATGREKARVEHYLREARNAYNAGRYSAAENAIIESLKIEVSNQEALDFKSKIRDIKDGMAYVRENLAKDHYYNALNYTGKGNMFEALIELKEAMALDPRLKEANALHASVIKGKNNILAKVNKKDRKRYEKALRYFLDGKYVAANKIVRSLPDDVPLKSTFMNAVLGHSLDEANKARSYHYCGEAVKSMKEERYLRAQEKAYLALEEYRNNVDARMLMVQINLELELLHMALESAGK